MPSHMFSIGFKVQDEDSFLRFADHAVHEGEAIPVKDGTYVRWFTKFTLTAAHPGLYS